jgi:hypothetical protein
VVLAVAVFDAKSWDALLAAFANLAAIVGTGSGWVAWIAMQDGEDIPGIADAAGLGAAIAFLPALVVTAYVYVATTVSGVSG